MTTPRLSRRLLRLAAALSVALLAACGGEDAADAGAPLPEGFTALPAGAEVPVAPPAERRCNPPSSRSVFRRPIEWESFWGMNPGCAAPSLPPGMDWQEEMLVLASMGKRRSARERIEIVGRGEKGGTLVVLVPPRHAGHGLSRRGSRGLPALWRASPTTSAASASWRSGGGFPAAGDIMSGASLHEIARKTSSSVVNPCACA